MAIAPLNIPANFQSPSLDFSPLANLGQIYQKAKQDDLRQQTLASLGQGGAVDAQTLLRSGDLNLAQLGIGLQNTEYQHGRDTKNDARTATNDAFSQNMEQQRLALARAAAARANDPTPAGFEKMPDGTYRPLRGGPQDPSYLRSVSEVGAGGKNGLQPVYGTDKDGNPVIMQMSPSGTAVQTRLPDGVRVSKEPIRIDAGTHTVLIDPITRQQIGVVPKNLSEVEIEKAGGESTAKAREALPTIMANSQQILKTLDDIEKHPGKASSVGMSSMIPVIPGTERANFRAAIDQLNGQTFLQAFQALKGGGAITDVEGTKGSNAIARMSQAQTLEAFNEAVKDFKDVVKAGMLRATAKARGQGSATQPAQPEQAANGMNKTSSGVPWSIQ